VFHQKEGQSEKILNQLYPFFKSLSTFKTGRVSQLLYRSFGFHLLVSPSIIPNAGKGLFLYGKATKGQIICLYPGMSIIHL